jgi:hypothetical protein
VSKASVSIGGDLPQQLPVRAVELDRASFAVHVRQTYRDAHRRERVAGRLWPLDEADRVGEVGLEIAPLRGREALEPVQVEVRDVGAAGVAMADRERRARDGDFDAECAAGAADERRLAGAELAGDRDDVTDAEAAREQRCDGLGRFGGGGLDQKRPS